jgi:hypothetical protein
VTAGRGGAAERREVVDPKRIYIDIYIHHKWYFQCPAVTTFKRTLQSPRQMTNWTYVSCRRDMRTEHGAIQW